MHKPALILTFVFLAQAGLFYGFSRGETTPGHRPFSAFPDQLGSWKLQQRDVMEEDVKNILRGDDYITAWYAQSPARIAHLFVAFFNSQRSGQTPHSPKNCLPGSGWVWTVSDEISLTVPGRAEPMTVNRYIVAKGDQKDVVLYWYQSRDRVVASEYRAMVFVAADALRYNRTDTSLVRVTVPITNNQEQAATDTGIEFIRSFFGILRSYFPA